MEDEANKELTPKEDLFAQRYIVDFNGAAAAREVGYSANSAKEIAAELLTKPHVQRRIKEIQQKLSEKNGDLAQRVIDELTKIGFSNIQDFIQDGNEIKDISSLDRDKAASISSIKKSKTTFGDGQGNEGEKEAVEFKMWDKLSALEKIGRHLGIFEADNKQKTAVINVNVTDDSDDGEHT
jgi:phage terminase small subunit